MLKVILSFDDGRKDNYRAAFEILKPLKIPATFNITTGYVLNNISEHDMPSKHAPMSIAELRELSECELFEIAGHGYRHDNDINNLLEGVSKLRSLLPDIRINGIASPHSEFDLNELETAKSLFSKYDIKYLRISNDYSKMSKMKIWIRRINRLLHSPSLYSWVNEDSINKNPDFLLHSVPVIRDNSLEEVKRLIDQLIIDSHDSNEACILMFHSILKPNEDFYDDLFTWDYYKFKELCMYLVKKSNEKTLTINKTFDFYKEI